MPGTPSKRSHPPDTFSLTPSKGCKRLRLRMGTYEGSRDRGTQDREMQTKVSGEAGFCQSESGRSLCSAISRASLGS